MTQARTHNNWRLWLRTSKALEAAVKSFGPIIAAIWIAWQYQQAQQDKRVESTLKYIARYEDSSTSIGKAQRALSASLWAHADEIAEFAQSTATSESITRIKTIISERIIENSARFSGEFPNQRPFDEIDDFFSALVTCIEGNVCDRDSALRYFGCTANQYSTNFFEIISKKRTLYSRFGWGINWLAKNSKEQESC